MTSPEFAIAIPQTFPDGSFDPGVFREFMERAEGVGFASAWTVESVLGPHSDLGPIELMSYAAACTSTIRLGCSVLVTTLHSPVHLAKSIASLDQLSRGRIDVGVGSGGGFRAFDAFGVEPSTYIARFVEGIDLMRRLWTDAEVNFDGRFWHLHGEQMEPKPFQKPGPPIWFGAGHPSALRRAVRLGDGFFGAGSSTTADFAAHVQTVRDELDSIGRDPATFRIAKRVYLTVDDDVARGRDRIGTELNAMYSRYGMPDMTPVTTCGSPADVAASLREVAAAGADLILLNPLFDHAENLERLAGEVLPLV
jgi:probable F420-dependent oxidoreductase